MDFSFRSKFFYIKIFKNGVTTSIEARGSERNAPEADESRSLASLSPLDRRQVRCHADRAGSNQSRRAEGHHTPRHVGYVFKTLLQQDAAGQAGAMPRITDYIHRSVPGDFRVALADIGRSDV